MKAAVRVNRRATLGASQVSRALPKDTQVRHFAKKPAKGGAASKAVSNATLPFKTHAPVNILKDGKDPELKAIEDYPPWVSTLTRPLPSFQDIHKSVPTYKDLFELNTYIAYRYFKLGNRKRIKEKNLDKLNS